jgi:hypothetical protein
MVAIGADVVTFSLYTAVNMESDMFNICQEGIGAVLVLDVMICGVRRCRGACGVRGSLLISRPNSRTFSEDIFCGVLLSQLRQLQRREIDGSVNFPVKCFSKVEQVINYQKSTY